MVTLRAKSKHYGPLQITGTGTERLSVRAPAGCEVFAGTQADAQTMSPGDFLMAALASCLTISLQMAARSAGVDTGEVRLSIEAFIDGGEPRRFDRFAVGVSMDAVTDRGAAEQLLARAKQLCTVSHTLNADIALSPA